jgi:hypothetical protein
VVVFKKSIKPCLCHRSSGEKSKPLPLPTGESGLLPHAAAQTSDDADEVSGPMSFSIEKLV